MISYNESKRRANLAKHGIDLADCEEVFNRPMLTEEDEREAYGEQRLKSLGWLNSCVVVLVWTDRETEPHVISCRYGDKHETERFFKAFV